MPERDLGPEGSAGSEEEVEWVGEEVAEVVVEEVGGRAVDRRERVGERGPLVRDRAAEVRVVEDERME